MKLCMTGVLIHFSKTASCRVAIFALACAVAVAACSSSAPMPTAQAIQGAPPIADSRIPSTVSSPLNQQRLKALWEKRAGEIQVSTDYPVGPGDVLEISVPGVDDLKDRTVRVSGADQIELPLL